jgi:hypothetical protein
MVSTVVGTAGRFAAGLAAQHREPSTNKDASKARAKTILYEITC